MNRNNFLKLKLIIIKLKREFPEIDVQYHQPNFLGPELCTPNNIYITKNGSKLFATFTSIGYKNLSITSKWTDSRFHQNRILVYESYGTHDFDKIKQCLIEKHPEFYFKNKLLNTRDPLHNEDTADYGGDLINLIDRISLECMHSNLGRKPLKLISAQDIIDYGGDFIGMIKTIVMNVIFERIWRVASQDQKSTEINIALIDADQLKKLKVDYGSDLVDVVYKHSRKMLENLNGTDFSEEEIVYQLLYERYPLRSYE
jgi:hypothetical protein